ncbi:endopeptidase IV [Legionella sp. km535]|uniref:endopeptidase IV n=1 Tax=Legionella sp. km535 TaxID=2498107 RepID=UPI000F8F554C|nr:endopeptidase IV [Legionella sp. km535]RUR19984.1 endopeptidase IV [Legionella sp. km535]
MNRIINRGIASVAIICLSGVFYFTSIQAAPTKKVTASEEKGEKKDNNKFPIGCTPVGFKQSLKVLSLYPGKEGALQSMYFFYNQLPQSVSLYQMRDKESEYSTRLNHTIKANSWAVLATGERELKYICTLGDGKTSYGKILDCADTIKVCEYVNVKFGLNNKGNFWIVDSNSRNGAVSEVVHYGIIPGV